MTSLEVEDGLRIVKELDDAVREADDDDLVNSDESSADPRDSEDENNEEISKIKIKQKFKTIIDELISSAKAGQVKSGSFDLTTSAGLQAFMDLNKTELGKINTSQQTLLHLIAESEKDELALTEMKDLITKLVELPDNLLGKQDENGKTPLFCAIAKRKHTLVRYMCDAHHDINSILRIPKFRRSANCIHQAIMNKGFSGDDELLKFLIGNAEKDTLIAMDENGLTPLHLAVEYKRCDDAQLDIVRALVRRCDKVLDMTYEHSEKGELSPYLYHKLTCEEEKNRYGEVPEKKRNAEFQGTQQHERLGVKGNPSGKGESRKQKLEEPPIPAEPTPPSFPHWNPTRAFDSKPRLVDRSRNLFPEASKINQTNKRETSVEAKKPSSVKKSKASKLKPTESSILAIRRYLKLECLRKKNHDDAVQFLYGAKQDEHIFFDLSGVSPIVEKSGITRGLSHLLLEDILQYVSIPRVEVKDDPVRLKTGQRELKPDGNGRTDMKPLFKWMRDEKKVQTILKVIVDDLQQPAHSDDSIKFCLTGMGVEIWQWKKFDLSPEVIQSIAPGVRIVHLYWSGNNTVLLGWSAPEGLRQLKQLEEVHLHVQQGLETHDRTKENVAAFRKRIENDTVKVYDTKLLGDTIGNAPNGADAIHDPYERHKWVASMEEFADFLQAAEQEIKPPLILKHPITVAVIDDGVDINDHSIQSRIIGGRSFCHRNEEQNLSQPYYVSGGGHGTKMAILCAKVCPSVNLYILRLDEYPTESGRRHITARSAARAVLTAIEQEVDIISMSWTIEKTDRNGDDIKKLEDAISLAARKNILMFCAATDQGAYKDNTYPAASATKNIFKIGAAEASGAVLKWVGDQSLVDFIFPGHKVIMERHDNPNIKNYTAVTGSSVATALASGLAAVILHCVQLADTNKYARQLNALTRYKSLKSHERMKEAFSQIGTTYESEHKYIMVWNRFTQQAKAAQDKSAAKDDYIDYIVALADELMRRA
ncbi:hypothetical protein F4806DRAFT_445844 [Annulohypoxylon nitens]|nr:hypothetical protein F4806DRAFT_445844 [Annulohypoxylon nitens]